MEKATKSQVHVSMWKATESPAEARTSFSDEDLLGWSKEDLLQRLRRSEADKMSVTVDHSSMIQEVNRSLQQHLSEIRELKVRRHVSHRRGHAAGV